MKLQLINKSAEVKLMQMLGDMRVQSAGWQAIHFHLADLLEEYKSEYQIKIAVNLIHDLLKSHEGTIFLLLDNSILVLCHKLEGSLLEKLIFQLRYLYMDDPLAYNEMGQENADFCTVYDLKRNWDDFYGLATHYMALFTRKQPLAHMPVQEKTQRHEVLEPIFPMIERPDRQSNAPAEKFAPDMKDKGEMSASKLATIERNLRYADLNGVIRRQPVCAVLSDMKVRRVFDELYIHIAQLRRMMKSEVDFLSNRWLFKYLTHILDERMIEIIRSNPDRYLNSPISINLNAETLLSPWFSEFDAAIAPSAKVSIVIEVPVVDMFADMTAFLAAQAEVQRLGYRICLDGLTTASFMNINREKLGLDLVKVQWNADLQSDLKSAENNALLEAVRATGSNRVILCRCDNKSAVEYGQALGISLFQGRFIDSVLNPTAKVEN